MAERERDVVKKNLTEIRNNNMFGINIPMLPDSQLPIHRPDLLKLKNPEDYAWVAIVRDVQKFATNLRKEKGVSELRVVEPPAEAHADLAVACFPLAKVEKKAPTLIAENLATELNDQNKNPFIKKVRADKGYLNFELNHDTLGNAVLNDVEQQGKEYGVQNLGQGATIVIDSSGPNVAKFMSVGHLRSTVIGESLSRIYRAAGYTVIRDNHLGDWGTQFGMLGHAYDLWANEIPAIRDGTDPVKGLYELYVKIHEEVESEKKANPDGESSLEKAGRAWFSKLENGDPEALKMLKWATTQSLAEFKKVYKLLGAEFEYMLGESFYVGMLPEVIESLVEKGIAEKDDKSATIVNLEDKKLHRLVIQKSDGASLYSTRDLATLAARTTWFAPEKILYVVGGDQADYFKQVFETFKKWSQGKGPNVDHVGFGMISLPEGKMSTRKGRVIFLEDVLSEVITRARRKIDEADRGLTEKEKENVARQIGVGAVIYFDLGQGRERNIKFDWDQALSLEGNSAPYIQYSHARARSVLRKAQNAGINVNYNQEATFTEPAEQMLVKHLSKFPDAIRKALDTNQPSAVAEYTFQAANLFSQLYQENALLVEKDPKKRNTRLRLTSAAAQVISNGLQLLGIEVPFKM